MIDKRNRFAYAGMAAVVMGLGLLSRKILDVLPDVLNIYAGDALWALMIFLGTGFVFHTIKTSWAGLISLAFCYLIECSQLYHADWIDRIRDTTLGGLVLGYGFLWSDLGAYTIGIGIGVVIDITCRDFMRHKLKHR
ncbi:DUF2809 domain-containing protein [Bacillus atrophaeus]|uniref:ribosomal maturation YjgA family protein n=1 Tax=Bacillus atrophaeus TaxID=1452 RepID=UPI00227F19F2|nr:DUF2809 domain-containing protein [Bacillus atrophaeus]MCY8512237.1 DUF2809 domain-containing protein [Bacillus atrophaeus]MCY8993076.1 DUF2809 domain-containing protein [Bacillus atrophaeus]